MVTRLDHTKAKFPDPSDKLFRAMAEVAYNEFVSLWGQMSEEKGKMQTWEGAGKERQMVWTSAMREVWKHMALEGGAKSRRVS